MTRSLMTSVLALTLASPALAVEKAEVIDTYADIAEAAYGDSLITAQALVDAVDALIAEPSADTMQAARTAWLAAGLPQAVPGVTVDRQCGSGQQAVSFAATAVMAGVQDLVVAGGGRVDPGSVDVELAFLDHVFAPARGFGLGSAGI